MWEPKHVEWIGTCASVIAALATAAAAGGAWVAARAAQKQVELMRPRPILSVHYVVDQEENWDGPNARRPIEISNIGTSPAFDVEVATLRLSSTGEGQVCSLATDRIAFLRPDDSQGCHHRFEPYGEGDSQYQPTARFAQRLSTYTWSSAGVGVDGDERVQTSVPFTVSCRALDGRWFHQAFRMVVRVKLRKVWIEAGGSLLDGRESRPRERVGLRVRRLLHHLRRPFEKSQAAGTST